MALDRSLTVIEVCQIEIQAWENCVENYNQLNGNEKGSTSEPWRD